MRTMLFLVAALMMTVGNTIAHAAADCEIKSDGQTISKGKIARVNDPDRGHLGNVLRFESDEKEVSVSLSGGLIYATILGPRKTSVASGPHGPHGSGLAATGNRDRLGEAGATFSTGEFYLSVGSQVVSCQASY
jgi:hypothetical protein